MAAAATAAAAAAADEEELIPELDTYTSAHEAYVYAPLPAATSYGHRAETWNPDQWLAEVKVKVTTAGDCCFVRTLNKDSGELFAECPLPSDGTPLTTAVEPVVDSSRYFVLRVEDRESGKHAFVGIGFRQRSDASDFTAALDDYRQFLRRKQEAALMRQQFEQQQLQQQQGGDAACAAAGPAADLALKPGQKLTINLSASLKRLERLGSGSKLLQAAMAGSGTRPAAAGGAAAGAAGCQPVGLKLPPPPGVSSSSSSSSFFRLQPPPPPSAASSSTAAAAPPPAAAAAVALGALSLEGQQQQQQQQQQQDAMGPASNPATPTAAGAGVAGAAAAGDDDAWGDFVHS